MGNETSTPGPKGMVPRRGPSGSAVPESMGDPGPRPDIMPDPLRSVPVIAPPAPVSAEDIAPAPAPVPAPDPVDSEGLWAWTVHSPPRATLRARTADLVPSRRLFHHGG